MVNLLTCFHTLSDPDVLSEKEWIEGCKTGAMDFSYIRKTVNCFDESALELACRFRDMGEENTTALTAVTIGDKTDESALRTLAALGFVHVARIDTGTENGTENLTSEETANALVSWIKRQANPALSMPFDLIITGQRSGDWNQAKVPMLIADQLGIRCLSNVTGFIPSDDKGAVVRWLMDDAVCSAYIEYPAVMSIGDVSGAFLRVPTLRQRMKSKQQPVDISMVCTDYLDEDQKTSVPSIRPVDLIAMEPLVESRDAVIIDNTSVDEASDTMLSYFREWIEE